jgi:hypothetical protein
MRVTKILSAPSQEFARHRLANLPVVNMRELLARFNIGIHQRVG